MKMVGRPDRQFSGVGANARHVREAGFHESEVATAAPRYAIGYVMKGSRRGPGSFARVTVASATLLGFLSFVLLFLVGVFVPAATDPTAPAGIESVVWKALGVVMMLCIIVVFLGVARLWQIGSGQTLLPWVTCAAFAVAVAAGVLAVYYFGIGIGYANEGLQPTLLNAALTVCLVAAPTAFVTGVVTMTLSLVGKRSGGATAT